MLQAGLVATCCVPVLSCGCGGLKAVENLDFPVGEWVSVGKASSAETDSVLNEGKLC